MIPIVFAAIIVILAAWLPNIAAQSARTEKSTDGKKNQRQSEAAPTPTPVRVQPPDQAAAADDGDVIRVATNLISVPVRVMDKSGRFVRGLPKESFSVIEDGVEQEIAMFSNEHQPFTVALMLDMSYSTKFKIAEIQSAAIAFIDQLRPQDKVMVVSFDGEVHMLCEPTTDRKEIYRAIKTTGIGTGTSLYEAVDLVMNARLRSIEGRKAIILFTDGVDTASRRSNDLQNLADAMELDALIYPVRYDTFSDVQRMKNGPIIAAPAPISIPRSGDSSSPFPLPIPTIGTPGGQGTSAEEYKKAEEYLEQLAVRTGGRVYPATTVENLAEAYSRIASELREFYSIGYYPAQDRLPGKRTQIKVKVDKPGLVVRARNTYIARKKK
jgi:VWFA-related protein